MNLRKYANRTAVAGVSTALATGFLVAATGTGAHADLWEAHNTYTCDFGGLATGDIDATVTVELPVSSYTAFTPVPTGIIPVTITAVLPADVATALAAHDVIGARADDFAVSLGTGDVPTPLAGDLVADGGVTTWTAEGSNGPFSTGDVGVVDGYLPETFSFTATDATDAAVGAGTCVLKDPEPAAVVSGFTLAPQYSRVDLPARVKATKGKKVVVPVSVVSTTLNEPVSGGTVVAKLGSKQLGSAELADGKAKLSLGKLPVGAHRITVVYVGISSVRAADEATKVVVK